MTANSRYSNGNARRKLRARLRAEGRGCWICRAFGRDDRIDYDLPAGHPGAFEVDELPSERGEYSITEAAGILGISRQRVHQLLQAGKLDGHKVGNTWNIYRYSVESWLS